MHLTHTHATYSVVDLFRQADPVTDDGDERFTGLHHVRSDRMSERIVRQIVSLARLGRLKPGDRLPPGRDLAKHFGVSRVTLRDGLRILEARGLVEIRRGASGGAFMTVPSTQMLSERLRALVTVSALSSSQLAETRLVLELGILDLVMDNVTECDLEALTDICERSTSTLAAGAYEEALSSAFHVRLAGATHSEPIMRISETFAGPLRMTSVRVQENRPSSFELSVADHVAITEAIREGDGRRARQLVALHLTRGTELVDLARRLADAH